jgi:hypothetical protein
VPLGRVCPAVNNFLTIVASAKDGMWCNHGNPTMLHKPSKPNVSKVTS